MDSPLRIPELLYSIIEYVDDPVHLAACARVNAIWNDVASQKLYRGSMTDIKLRTPDIGSLDKIFTGSHERFARTLGYVQHLSIVSESQVSKPRSGGCEPHDCKVQHCVMQDHAVVELLPQLHRPGPKSLAIPFHIKDSNPAFLSALIRRSSLEYLIINNVHCEQLVQNLLPASPSLNTQIQLSAPLLGLKALSINESIDVNPNLLDAICRLLKVCSLRVFQLQMHGGRALSDGTLGETLLDSLTNQSELRALSIFSTTLDFAHPRVDQKLEEYQAECLWPKLKLLYLRRIGLNLLQRLPKFTELEHLGLHSVQSQDADLVVQQIRKIPHLKSLKVFFIKKLHPDILFELAENLPHLRKFHIDFASYEADAELSEQEFLRLIKALPLIQSIKLGFRILLGHEAIRYLSIYCPRLRILRLHGALLPVTLEELEKTAPYAELKTLKVLNLRFEDPQRLVGSSFFPKLLDEWNRVFPNLEECICGVDGRSSYKRRRFIEWINYNTSSSPDYKYFDDPDYEIDSDELRMRLWIFLDRQVQSLWEYYKTILSENVWQAQLESDTVGWPVLHWQAAFPRGLTPVQDMLLAPKQRSSPDYEDFISKIRGLRLRRVVQEDGS